MFLPFIVALIQSPKLEPVWSSRLQTQIQSYQVGEQSIFFGTNNSYGAISQSNGNKVWAKSIVLPQLGVHIVEGDGVLYANIGQGSLTALEANSGKSLWSLKRTGYASPMGYANKFLYAELQPNKLTAISSNGKPAWTADLEGSLSTRPIRYNQSIFAGLKTGQVLAFHKDTGKAVWRLAERKSAVKSLIISNERLLATYDDGTIHGISLETGQRMWAVYTNNALFGTPLLRDARLFAVSASGRFYSIAAESGQELWVRSLSFRQNFGLSQPMTYQEGFLIADKSKLVHLSESGEKVWEVETGSEMFGNQPRALGNDLLLTGSHEFRRVKLLAP